MEASFHTCVRMNWVGKLFLIGTESERKWIYFDVSEVLKNVLRHVYKKYKSLNGMFFYWRKNILNGWKDFYCLKDYFNNTDLR